MWYKKSVHLLCTPSRATTPRHQCKQAHAVCRIAPIDDNCPFSSVVVSMAKAICIANIEKNR